MSNLLINMTERYLTTTIFDNITETVTPLVTNVAGLPEPVLRTFLRYILVGWATLIIGVFGLFGNALSGIILIKPSMRSSLNLLLFFLTIWDALLLITTILYLSIPTIVKYLELSRSLVNVWIPCSGPYLYALRCTAQLGSALFTLLVTSERYIAVCWPLQSRTLCTKKKALIAAGITSVFVIMYNLSRFWDFEAVQITRTDDPSGNETSFVAYEMKSTEFRLNPTYYMVYLTWGAFVTSSAIPFVFLSVFNYFICRALSNFNKTRKIMTNGSQHNKEITLTKMFVCVITVSLLGSGLNLFLAIIDTFWVLDLSWQLWYVEKVLMTFNSSVNCVFYCAFGTRFRQEFKKMFGFKNKLCGVGKQNRKPKESTERSYDTNETNTQTSEIQL